MKGLKFFTLGLLANVVCFAAQTGFKSVAGRASLLEMKDGASVSVSANSIVKWDNFSIAPHETVSFHMNNPKYAVLNRVTGKNKSVIEGQLRSNGRVYIANPQGVLIAANAYIKTAGFLATTGHVHDQQFLEGKEMSITNLSADGKVVDNRGVIKTKNGDVFLIASKVVNTGKIIAPEGCVGLAVGQEVIIKPNGPERIFIKPGMSVQDGPRRLFGSPVTTRGLAIDNVGEIEALVTEIKTHRHPYSKAISHSGQIQGTKLKSVQGRVLLVAEDSEIKISGSVCSAGGHVKLDAAEKVSLLDNAKIDVSDYANPGKIEIGSRSSKAVEIGKNVAVHADNLKQGAGGTIVILSSQNTDFLGTITAEAKGSSGDGGLVEVACDSGHGLAFRGKTSLKSAKGKDGTLLVDP